MTMKVCVIAIEITDMMTQPYKKIYSSQIYNLDDSSFNLIVNIGIHYSCISKDISYTVKIF